ncbi:MAG TPA: ABC transporter permease subunit [Gemmatimonadaceae bacterium]
MGTVYRLALRQLTGKWRLIIMTVLAALPVIIAGIMITSPNAPTVQEFEVGVLGAMLSGSIAPLVVLAIAAAAFANEVEDRTLANLVLSPLPRWQIAIPKLLATITVAAPFIAVSAFATTYIAFLGDMKAVVAVTVASIIGVALYSAAFIFLGLVTTYAIGIGLLYIVVWEGFFSGFVTGVRLLSIRHYTIALMHGLDPRRLGYLEPPSLLTVSIISAIVFVGFAYASVRRLKTMDVP